MIPFTPRYTPQFNEIHVIRRSEVKGGDVLVPLRLITTSALLLDKKIRVDAGRFLDFCTLIPALAFHDRIITLPVEYLPDELLNTSLFSYLTDEKVKILNVLDWNVEADFDREIRDEIQLLFGQEVSELDSHRYLESENFEDFYAQEMNKLDRERKDFIDHVMRIVEQKDWNHAIPYAANKEDELAFRFRTALYTEISETLRIPLTVDFTRIPIIQRYHARIQKSLRTFILSIADEIALKQLDDASKIVGSWPVPVASPVLQFLRQYSSPNVQPGEVLENMRTAFNDIRRQIIDWEDTFMHIDTIGPGEALDVVQEIYSKIDSIQDEVSISNIFLSFAPAIVPPVDPNKIIELAKKGKDLLKWLLDRRQMSYYITGKDEINKIVGQKALLRNAFDYYLTDTEKQKFLYLSNYLEKLTEPLVKR